MYRSSKIGPSKIGPSKIGQGKIGLGLIGLAAAALNACGGGTATAPTVPSAPTSSVNSYAGPAPATADVQAFAVNFWNNVRVANRCGQCHNATTPAQMPNFARSDDVNLAYAQANTVVDLTDPGQSRVVIKVAGGHNCWLSDNNACAIILTQWITNWAGASAGTGTQVQLSAPTIQSVGQSKNFPPDPTDFQQTVYPLLSKYCSRCHSPNAAVPQSPYFASSDINQAYQAALPKMDLNNPPDSRFVVRLGTESHNCWDLCSNDAAQMLAAIQSFATMVPLSSLDPSLVTSKALRLSDGIVASGSNRFDANVIAKYEFQTGSGNTAFDTSGVDPAADLTLSGQVTWAGGWGINVPAGGKAQAATGASKKIHDLIEATGEFSVEAWVAPASVAADKSYMVSYSGGDTARNFTLGQTKQDYDFMLRSSASDTNGMPQLMTPDAALLLQASLQHVVLTYDPVNGRQIYVNGVSAGLTDPQKGGTIANWDPSFALVLGNEVSGDRSWTGLIKFVAIHSRALTPAQVLQNFNAGVGQRYFMLFNVAAPTGVSQAYVMFTVSQYDSYSYLFAQPTFISLDPTVKPDGVVVKGIRIGINGAIPAVGQAYIPLNTTVTAASYTSQGEVLSPIGTVIALQNPATDQFFLSFDQLGSQTHVVVETSPVVPAPTDLAPVAAIGIRTFAQINSSLSALTGVPTTQPAVMQTYQAVQQQLPSDPTFEGFLASNQVGVAQLAIQYCNVMVNTPALQAQVFPGVAFGSTLFSTPTGISSVTSALAARVLGTGLNSQPAASTVTTELNSLISKLCSGGSPCSSTARVLAVTSAACAAALGSADVLIN
jgi:hypothetical protein